MKIIGDACNECMLRGKYRGPVLDKSQTDGKVATVLVTPYVPRSTACLF
jgi:hypothetical protein